MFILHPEPWARIIGAPLPFGVAEDVVFGFAFAGLGVLVTGAPETRRSSSSASRTNRS